MDKTRQKKSPFSRLFAGRKGRTTDNKYDYYDFSLLAVIILLTCFGLVMLYSTSAYMAEMDFHDDMHYFRRQALISVFSIAMAIIISRIDYHILSNFTTIAYFGSLFLMALVKTPLGVTSHGARRWLGVTETISFQPAEVAKIALILYLAQLIVTMGRSIRSTRAFFLMLIAGGLQAFAAYAVTDNRSTAIIILGITVGMVFIAHPNRRLFWMMMGAGAVVVLIQKNLPNGHTPLLPWTILFLLSHTPPSFATAPGLFPIFFLQEREIRITIEIP